MHKLLKDGELRKRVVSDMYDGKSIDYLHEELSEDEIDMLPRIIKNRLLSKEGYIYKTFTEQYGRDFIFPSKWEIDYNFEKIDALVHLGIDINDGKIRTKEEWRDIAKRLSEVK